MKKRILFIIAATLILSMSFAQKSLSLGDLVYFPDTKNPVIKMQVPSAKWNVTNENNLLSIIPKDSGETSRLITMLWASENPYNDDAMTKIVNDAFDIVETLLTDITWQEDMNTFEHNGISYTALDGVGYYQNDDGSKDKMSTSIMILIPDEVNVLALVFFGTNEAYTKWEEQLLNVFLSIEPTK